MISVPARRVKQFGVEFYQAALSAKDIDRLVKFEVLGYSGGPAANEPTKGRPGARSRVNWDSLEKRISRSEERRVGRRGRRRRCGEAEEAIRDPLVTGFQTCALPISARRVKQFGVEFYQAALSAKDIDRLVKFEVLGYSGGPAANEPTKGRPGARSRVNWDSLEKRISESEQAYQRPVIRRKIDELAAYYRECKDAGTL